MATFYIQLKEKLLKISGDLTHDNIVKALGYTPSDFSGNFNDLSDNPFTQNEDGKFNITDEEGNIIATVDEEGIHSVDFIAGEHRLTDKIDATALDGLAKETWVTEYVTKTVTEGKVNLDGYATEEWVEKQGFAQQSDLENIDFNTLKENPFSDDENGELNVVDDNGNVILKVNENGLQTIDVIAGDHILSNKVDKESGKGLSTEDFTTALKTKLQSLSNYDDTTITNAINTLRDDFDTLVSGDTTTAIKTFNEIIAFLNGVEDTESLEGIIASIEQQIANIEIPSLDGYATESWVNDKNYLTQHQDISHLATKTEVNDSINDIEFFSIKNNPIADTEDGNLIFVDETGNIGLKLDKDNNLTVADVVAGEHILSNKADKSDLEGLATESYVITKVAEAKLEGSDITIPVQDVKVNGQTVIKDMVADIDLTPYAKTEDVPSIEGLATEQYVDEKFSSIEIPEVDFTGYAKVMHYQTKEEFDNELEQDNISDDVIYFIDDTKEIITHKNIYKSVNWGILRKNNIMSYKTNFAIINAILRQESTLFAYEDDFYYNTIEDAIVDINNNALGILSVEQSLAKVKVTKNNIFLLENAIINSPVDITATINLYTNGKNITVNSPITVNGTLNIYGDKSSINSTVANFLLVNGYCSLFGGKYTIKITDNGTSEVDMDKLIEVNGSLMMKNVTINASNPIGAASVIYANENSKIKGFNTIIECSIKGGFIWGIYNKGDLSLSHCKVVAYADHTANAAGTNYATTSRGIYTEIGNVELYECYVYGAHSGITSKSPIKITGGIYDGFSHGGLYLSNGNVKTELYDAEFKDVDIPEGYTFDTVAGTNGAAFYIGAANNMQVYCDNCRFYGHIQPIVMKYSSSSSHDNYLYLSNATVNYGYSRCAIRNDGANYVKFGINNNITSSNLENKQNWEDTGLCYKQ